MPKAIDNDEDSRSRQIQARFPISYRPLTRAQYASHVVMFEGTSDVSLAEATREQVLTYLRSLSSKGMKRRGIQALRVYLRVLRRDGARADDPMKELALRDVHTDPPSVHDLRERLMRAGLDRRIIHRLTWSDLTLLSLRAQPFANVSRIASGLASLYLDGRIGGRRVLRALRARAHRPVSEP
jgi:hypothetical protein